MATDGREHWRKVFLEPLGAIGGRQAIATLVRLSFMDNNVHVRDAAAEAIRGMENRKQAIPEYIKYLRADRYSAAAAEALCRAGLTEQVSMVEEPDPALTHALIDALVCEGTRHVPVVVWAYAYWRKPGGGHGSHYERRVVDRQVPIGIQNPQALRALKEYTGKDHGYDKEKWRVWYRREVSRAK